MINGDNTENVSKQYFISFVHKKMKITYFLFNMEYGILPVFSINKNKNKPGIK